jgi:hypothetical protein
MQLNDLRECYSKIKPLAQCPWHSSILQDPIENVFSYDSMEDHTVLYKCRPENFRGHFLRRPFQALSNVTVSDDQLKTVDVYLKTASKRILLESCNAIAGTVELQALTSPTLFFLETDPLVYLELECNFSTDDIDELPDFVGRAMGYRFGMPDQETVLGLLKCPEATLHIAWSSQTVI